MASLPTVGIIGCGFMGSAMAGSLLKSGADVVAYDVAPAALRRLAAQGAIAAGSNAEVAARVAVVITSLPSAAALESVVAEIASVPPKDLLVIETSTLPLAVKEAAQRRLESVGVTMLDCPLSGTGAEVRTKNLTVYASGPRAAYEICVPVLEGFARAHYYVGEFGAGSKMKFVANLLVAIHNVAAAEAMVLATKAGLEPERVVQAIRDGAGNSRMFEVRAPMMVANDYADASMRMEMWQKDMQAIGDFARALDCPTPLFAATAPLYNAALAFGHANEDTASVCAVLGELAGIKPSGRKQSS